MNNGQKFSIFTDLILTVIDNRGKSVPTSEKGFPLIATNCIKLNSIYPTFENVRYVSEETMRTWFRAHIKPNDILLVNKGTPGRTCLVPNPVNFCVAQDMVAVRVDENKISYKYLFAVLRSNYVQQQISNFHVGLVIPHFKKGDFDKLMIPRLSTKKQEDAVGNLYMSISEKIELNNKINSELEAMAKTIYDYWFVQFDFPDKYGKPYKTSGGKMIWSEELKKEIPAGWKVGIASELFEFNPSLSLKMNSEASYIDMDALPTEGYMTKAVQRKEFRGGIKFQNGDLLLARITPCLENGKTGLVTLLENEEIGFGSTEFIVLRGKNRLLSCFAAYLSRSELFRKYAITNMTGTSGRKRIDSKVLEKFPIPIPENYILDKFEKKVSKYFQLESNNTLQNQRLVEFRDWLLPMLMNGQIKINAENNVSSAEITKAIQQELIPA